MEQKRSWWQQIKQYQVAIVVVAIVLVVVIALIIIGYWFDWTGFNGYNKVTTTHIISGTNAGTVTKGEEYQPGKTLWDWLSIVLIPIVLGAVGLTFTQVQKSNEQIIAIDTQRETALQAYIDKMSEILLHDKLRGSAKEDEVRKIARVRTLRILARLDANRKGSVLQFLYEADLIDKDQTFIDLSEADFSGANLSDAKLARANLVKTNLREADLRKANLQNAVLSVKNVSYESQANLNEADLSEADLRGAYLGRVDLREATLHGTDLSGVDLTDAFLNDANLDLANLKRAKITPEQLAKAKSLKGATMPNGDIHP